MKKHKLILNGEEVSEKEFHRRGRIGGQGIPMITKTYTDANPWVGDIGSGVLPNQIAEARALVAANNLTGVRILDDGKVECTSRGETGRLGWYKLKGGVDGDGGYGETYNSRT